MTDQSMVLVPRRLLEELMAYMQPVDGEPLVDVPGGNGTWSKTMLEQLHHDIQQYDAALAMLDYAARNAGRRVSLDDIVKAFPRVPREKYQTQLASMTKACNRLFGKKVWPIVATQGFNTPYYEMGPEMATWWIALRPKRRKAAK